jgi:peptidoglycan/LPS O-acetylase OafA/YrhL
MSKIVIKYRPEIDGLRALAVILVLLVHTFPESVKNGFIGVDIFFVISGYLITSIVASQLNSKSFSIVDFYIRRANRIFPALILTLVACLAFGWFSLFASEYQLLGRSAFAGAAFGANVNAFLEGGYWDVDAKLKPLLHLWSLGVEEQFYLFWPLMLWVVWSRRVWLIFTVAILLVASLILNLWYVQVNQPATFYLPFSRVWELAAGGLLALVGPTRLDRGEGVLKPGVWAGAIALLGLSLILTTLLMPVPGSGFPGKYAILPVLGTALVIAAGPYAWANSAILAHPWLVYIGLISFPLYMWHYPILAFARVLENGKVNSGLLFGSLALTVALAAATYHLVEQPIRGNSRYRGTVALFLASLLAVSGAAGYLVFAREGFEGRYSGAVLSRINLPTPHIATNTKLAVIGDSNAAHLTPGLGMIYGNNFEMIATPGWPYLLGTSYRPGFPRHPSLVGTPQTTEAGLQQVLSDSAVDVVVLSNAYSMYMNQDLLISQSGSSSNETGAAAYELGLARTVRFLVQNGKKVIVFKSIPTRGDVGSIFSCASSALPIPRRQPIGCERPLQDIKDDRQAYDQAIDRSLGGLPNVWVFDPLPYLCDDHHCYIERDSTLLYGDMSHLSLAGSQMIGIALSNLVEKARSSSSHLETQHQ